MKRIIAATVTIAAALTACSADRTEAESGSESASKPSLVYDRDDCLERLNRIYVPGVPRDISAGAECASLTPVEYAGLVVQVLGEHEDDSLTKARNVVSWDIAWGGMDVEMQDATCELLRTKGIYEVGDQIGGGRADEDDTEMALYLLTNECGS
ncbi:hypothetical protein OG393_15145 [Streptomyces sp. NBC_01216]|uniref:hypothetical protein n=1 Tax=Streptomyces sp. NBC_01216 TaxID=2903778 RepID=UPI002E0DC82E|nr:hypothetical protein OG393_15145 [Streptomyces sp. NBC_01216]